MPLSQEQAKTIDKVRDGAIWVFGWVATVYPPLKLFLWVINTFITYEAWKIKSGLANGDIVPDGHGGFVPATNSHYDAKTGRFTSGWFS